MKLRFQWAWLCLMVLAVAAGCGQAQQADYTNGSHTPAQNGQVAPPAAQNQDEPPTSEKPAIKKTVSLYFSDKELMKMYRTEAVIEIENEEDAPKAALEVWIKGPDNDKLANLVPPGVVVQSVKDVDGVAHVSFSRELKNANLGSGGELFLMDQIALIMKQFGYGSTQILIEGNVEETLLGHMTISEPHPAPNPDDYELLE